MNYEIKPALILDLDGTVRRTKSGKPFSENPDDVELVPGMLELICKYRDKGYCILGVTNQGGVAHGYKKLEEVVLEIHNTLKLCSDGSPSNPIVFDAIYLCALDAAGTVPPWNMRSLRRKPDIGMLVEAEIEAREQGVWLDWDNSLFVGDREEDRQCAENARVPFMWVWDFLEVPKCSCGAMIHSEDIELRGEKHPDGATAYSVITGICPKCKIDYVYEDSTQVYPTQESAVKKLKEVIAQYY